ncbi:MAG: DUF1552 domain-containing protein [Bdellovibrionales bacterium]|nr:DUF1552 domain-containing protein [Bdellovibrionales bacterium]
MDHKLLEQIGLMSISRRRLLHVMGGSFIFFLPILKYLRAEAAGIDSKRFLFVYTSNGLAHDRLSTKYTNTFFPDAAGRNFNFSYSLSPLNPLKSKVITIDGVHINSADFKYGHAGQTSILSGYQNFNETLDVFLSRQAIVTNGTFMPRINLAVAPRMDGSGMSGTISYKVQGGSAKVQPENNPRNAFDKIFANMNVDVTSGPAEMTDLRAKRKSVLDKVIKDFNNLKNDLSAKELSSIQDHMDAVRDLEREIGSIEAPIPAPNSCTIPGRPAIFNNDHIATAANQDDPDIELERIMKTQFDLVQAAFKCDRTRIATLMVHSETSQSRHPFLASKAGVSANSFGGFHGMSHNPEENWRQLREIQKWTYEHVANLALGLDAVNVGGATMLDKSLIWVGGGLGNSAASDLGFGGHHSTRIPCVLIGGCGGYFDTGQSIVIDGVRTRGHGNRYGVSQTAILSAVCSAMGVPRSTYGDPAFAAAPYAKIIKT